MEIFAAGLLLVLLSSCSLLGPEPDRPVINVVTETVEVTEVKISSVVFAYAGYLPNPCYDLLGPQTVGEGSTIRVAVRARGDGSRICPAVIRPVELSLRIPVPKAGEYEFRFWGGGGDTTDVVLNVTVP